MPKAITFRVANVPADLTVATLPDYLAKFVPGLEESTNVHVRSLAPSLDAISTPPDQTATVDFDELPQCFSSANEYTWRFKTDQPFSLVFDRSFIGFTPLNTVDQNDYVVDCIAVHGLAGPPFGSWRQRSTDGGPREQFMWLRDQLPHDIPNARILIYGYDTKLQQTQSFQAIEDLAQSFLSKLMNIGTTEPSARPIVIFAHSLGGILVKRAIQYLASMDGPAELQILRNIRLFVFFGVPHSGMFVQHLTTIVEGQPNEDLISKLDVGSETLRLLDESFSGVLARHPARILSAYETVRSPVARVCNDGTLERSGKEQILVSKQSAIHPLSNIRDRIQIEADHSNMVKFGYNEPTYLELRRAVIDCIKGLPHPTTVDLGSIQSSFLKPFNLHAKSAEVLPGPVIVHGDESSPPIPQLGQRYGGKHQPDPLHYLSEMKRKELDLRYHAIEDAHERTFAWILDDRNLEFLDWIREGRGIYWIRGKPASGKSTLFRYLHDNHKFKDALANHVSRAEHFQVWHFFNIRGSTFSQSIEGLVCNILAQLATSNAVLNGIIRRCYASRSTTDSERWTSQEMKNAFAAVMNQSQADVQITVFIDALDEFYGLPVTIAAWIKSHVDASQRPGSCTTVRFCFSSREWDSFMLAFSEEPGLQLQEHTKPDIRAYALSRLHRLPVLSSHDDNSEDLGATVLDMIVGGADGVFLWVKLALDELSLLPASTTTTEVIEALEGLPEDLEVFYKRTLRRIEPAHKTRAFVFLELVLRSPAPLTLQDLAAAEASSPGTTLAECEALLDEYQLRERQSSRYIAERNSAFLSRPAKILRARIRNPANGHNVGTRTLEERTDLYYMPQPATELLNLCGGLLECISESPAEFGRIQTDELMVTYVQFIHRTVQDFAKKPEFAQLLLGAGHTIQPENGFTYLLKYRCIIPYTKIADGPSPQAQNPDYHVLYLANRHEATIGRPNRKFLNSLSEKFLWGADRGEVKYSSLFQFAVAAGLQSFVADFLTPSALPETQQRHPRILDYLALIVVDRWQIGYRWHLREADFESFQSAELTKLLLQRGFSPFNAFDTLLRSSRPLEVVNMAETLIRFGGVSPNTLVQDDFPLHHARGGMLAMLFRNGADPNVPDRQGSTTLDKRIGCPKSVFSVNWDLHRADAEASLLTTDLRMLVENGAKFTRRGQMVLPIFLTLFRRRTEDDVVDFLEDVEVLDRDVSTEDIPDYSKVTGPQLDDLASRSRAFDFKSYKELAEELEALRAPIKPAGAHATTAAEPPTIEKKGFRHGLRKLTSRKG